MTFVSSIIVKIILGGWYLGVDDTKGSLENAGEDMGILERLFVFGFAILIGMAYLQAMALIWH